MAETLDALMRISPPAFAHDNALCRMDKAYCVARTTLRFDEALAIVRTIDKRRLEEYWSEEDGDDQEGHGSPISDSCSEQLTPIEVEAFERALRICSEMIAGVAIKPQ